MVVCRNLAETSELLDMLRRMDEGYTPTREEEEELRKITHLDLSRRSLEALPNSLGKLTWLKSLDVSENELKELPGDLGSLTDLIHLDVSENRLTELPESLGCLVGLQFLDVSDNGLTRLPESLGSLTRLESLDVHFNNLEKLPQSLSGLVGLKSLDVSNNDLPELPDGLWSLTSLRSLDVGGNRLSELPKSLGALTRLEFLSAEGNALTALPDELEALTQLQYLNLLHNAFSECPESITRLLSLQDLNLTRNMLTALPKSIKDLTKLKSLGLGGNQLKCLPDELAEITGLKRLYLWGNDFSEFPTPVLSMMSLEALDFSDTVLPSIPPEICRLKKLKEFDLSYTTIHQFPREIMELGLPFVFDEMRSTRGDGIILANATIATQPISLFMQPREFIQAYFDMEQAAVNEGKVIFLGYGDVGKSYSILRILNHDEPGDFQTSMTPGISISQFPVEQDGRKFDICFWDFGGQEIMHAMHRCFLTHRTCYVVMVSNRQPDLDGQARYWLRNIESFAGGSDVLLAINQWENYPANKDLNYSQLRKDFGNLFDCVSVSAKCDDKKTFHQLTEKIIQMAARLDSTGMNFPVQWYNIRQALMNMKESGKYYISQDDYYQICAENGLKDANIRMWLLEWFNDLGTCFSYHQDTDKKELKGYKVLNPEWLTNAIYLIILHGKRSTENGVISRREIEHLLANPTGGTLSGVAYTPEECEYILEVMRKFTLSYPVSDIQEFIPALCPNETPGELHPAGMAKHLTYELKYTYLPDSVVHQLMIYCYQYLRLDKCWRKGMTINLRGMGLSAVVSMGGSDRLLSIDVYSESKPMWQLLQPLLDAIQRINTKLNLKATDYVCVETVVDGTVYPDRFELEQVLNVWKGSPNRRPSDRLQGKAVDYSIPELLAELYGEESIKAVEAETEKAEEASKETATKIALTEITLSNCVVNFVSGNQTNLSRQDISKDILKTILEHEEELTDKFTDELAEIFVSQGNEVIRALGDAMQSAPQGSRFKTFREWLGTADNLTSIAANLHTLWPVILPVCQQVPSLFAQIGGLIP